MQADEPTAKNEAIAGSSEKAASSSPRKHWLDYILGVIALAGFMYGISDRLQRPALSCVAHEVNLSPTDSFSVMMFNFINSFSDPAEQVDMDKKFDTELRRLGYSDTEIHKLKDSKNPQLTQTERHRAAYAVARMQSMFSDKISRSIGNQVIPPGGVILLHIENSGRVDAEGVNIEIRSVLDIKDISVQAPGLDFHTVVDKGVGWVKFDRLSPASHVEIAAWLSANFLGSQYDKDSIDITAKNLPVLHAPIVELGPSPAGVSQPSH